MFVRTLADVEAAGRLEVQWNATVQSARILTAADGMGFSLHENRVTPGEVIAVWYKHHWEANYIISGRARIVDLDHGGGWTVGPGDSYQVGPKDRHTFEALEDELHLSIMGKEFHLHVAGDYGQRPQLPARRHRGRKARS